MRRNLRNPFKLRAAEFITSDTAFLRFFEPRVLTVLKQNDFNWSNVQIIRSSPGGGKTSLMHVFSPGVLRTLSDNRHDIEFSLLLQLMEEFGAINDSGPAVLAVYISCHGSYDILNDLDTEEGKKIRFFYALMNSRLTLATLQNIMLFKQLSNLDELRNLKVSDSNNSHVHEAGVRVPSNGYDLYKWAEEIENNICEFMDSLDESPFKKVQGHQKIFAHELFNPKRLTFNSKQLFEHIAFMLDDIQELSLSQRRRLLGSVINARSQTGFWLAERLEALESDEMLASGAKEGRDYKEIIYLEDYWRLNSTKFEELAYRIADRRARDASSDNFQAGFRTVLHGKADESQVDKPYQPGLGNAIATVKDRLDKITSKKSLYSDWYQERMSQEVSPYQKLLSLRELEILIQREEGRRQKTFEFPLPVSDLEKKSGSDVKGAAEVFLAKEFKLNYFYGPSILASLSSSNIEQFLMMAGNLFEESVSAALIGNPTGLSSERQQAILKKISKNFIAEIPRRVPFGSNVKTLIGSVGKFCVSETFRENAPYSPGVTGIALTHQERDYLCDTNNQNDRPELKMLEKVLSHSVANNILEVRPNQKCQGKDWVVFYLNRLICLHYDLPLQYGGWRSIKVNLLVDWLSKGFQGKRATLFGDQV